MDERITPTLLFDCSLPCTLISPLVCPLEFSVQPGAFSDPDPRTEEHTVHHHLILSCSLACYWCQGFCYDFSQYLPLENLWLGMTGILCIQSMCSAFHLQFVSSISRCCQLKSHHLVAALWSLWLAFPVLFCLWTFELKSEPGTLSMQSKHLITLIFDSISQGACVRHYTIREIQCSAGKGRGIGGGLKWEIWSCWCLSHLLKVALSSQPHFLSWYSFISVEGRRMAFVIGCFFACFCLLAMLFFYLLADWTLLICEVLEFWASLCLPSQ